MRYHGDVSARFEAAGPLGLVQAFASTHAYRGHADSLIGLAEARDWCSARGLRAPSSPSELALLRTLRDIIRSYIAAADETAARLLSDQLDGHVLPVVRAGTGVRFRPAVATSSAEILAAIANALLSPDWSRLHLCANRDECGVAFFDQSRSRQGKWCSASLCGNRVNSRAHRSRTRSASI
jgi:predicted RNA-binding Zn ribbon-like protein